MSQAYKTLLKSELKDMITEHTLKLFWQREDNYAIVYEFIDGNIALLPIGGVNGILFSSKRDYEEVLKDGIIPLTNTENFFESRQELLSTFPDAIDSILSELKVKLKIRLDVINFSENYIDSLEQAIKKYKKAFNDLYFPLGVYLGEIVRLQIKGNWDLNSRVGINKYLELIIRNGTKEYDPWVDVNKYLRYKGKIDLDTYTQFAIARSIM